MLRRDLVNERLQVIADEGRSIDANHLAMNAEDGRVSGGQVQIGGTLLLHEFEVLIDTGHADEKASSMPRDPAKRYAMKDMVPPRHSRERLAADEAKLQLRLPMKAFLLATLSLVVTTTAAEKIKVLILDGQNNHKWKDTSPVLKQILEEPGIFAVEVSTSPEKGKGIDGWQPDFSRYAVVVSNYNGEPWAPAVQDSFEKFVSGGGGFVPVHAANNAFPEWKAYNEMIGVGGWGGRNEKSGPYLRWRDGKWMFDTSSGRGGGHGKQHEFVLNNRAPQHPIMVGLPAAFMHRQDELYDRLRGPAKNVTVIASAVSSAEKGGTGEEEPLLMTLPYGKGRVFHTALGHGLGGIAVRGVCRDLPARSGMGGNRRRHPKGSRQIPGR